MCFGQVQPRDCTSPPLDGLVPTRRTCISMPGAIPVLVFAGISVVDATALDNSQNWLKGTCTTNRIGEV
jgi:hypothetical protein